jgi:hypothetical protein
MPLLNFSLRSLNANSLRPPLFFKLKPHVVVSGIREVSQSVGHSHDEENSRIAVRGHAGIALFDLPPCSAADRCTLRSQTGRDTTTTSVPDVMPQLAKPAPHGNWQYCRFL